MEFKPGTLVHVRNRDWVVQPSDNEDLLRLKPLGGIEEEITGIYLPLHVPEDRPTSISFPLPEIENIGDITSAKILFNAVRLSFRTGAGPFRSFGKLSFRPRAYQIVPLIMALKQDPVRILIADDVGIGKTIEGLLIVKEMLERSDIKRFAVVCPPHLCDQWASEIKEKFNIEPVVIRSESAAALDRQLPPDTSPFRYFPYQVISIDYIKMDPRRRLFIDECPRMLLVDEAHTVARPPREDGDTMMRHSLIQEISEKEDQHLLLLTATPHSGIESSFQSLLGMLKPEFQSVVLTEADQSTRREVAKHLVQRRRGDVKKWLDEETKFPKRDPIELEYSLKGDYLNLFTDLLDYTKEMVSREEGQRHIHYWTALGLLRGVISSPEAGSSMLRKRASKQGNETEELDDDTARFMVMDGRSQDSDIEPISVVSSASVNTSEVRKLRELANRLDKLGTKSKDHKANAAIKTVNGWLEDGYHPIVFCKYIATANYLAKLIDNNLPSGYKRETQVESVTSELSEEQRRERVEFLGKQKNRVLVATDCLSEGINLQDHFTAVLHYDLPWNPNKIEQREGRIDRFGQTADEVKTALLYGDKNPIDATVLRVLLRKAIQIKKDTGISIPFPEDSESIIEAVLNAVLLDPHRDVYQDMQLQLGFEDSVVKKSAEKAEVAFKQAEAREKATRSIFAQHAMKPEEIEQDLTETDKALGKPEDVEAFLLDALERFGAEMRPVKNAPHTYYLTQQNLPGRLKQLLPEKGKFKVGFKAPLPENVLYLGRNHPFIEQVCQEIMNEAFDVNDDAFTRMAVIRTDQVTVKTTLVLLRVRNVISRRKEKDELVAEEMLLWGYRGDPFERDELTAQGAKSLLEEIRATENVDIPEQQYFAKEELEDFDTEKMETILQELTAARTEVLIDAHDRYHEAVGGGRYVGIEPVLPPDVIGMYILVPTIA
ncbi:MAG: DEAD/DEAH box helicase [Candidatus Marinimicrobia bacterium]|nr:DEAD/DEAH box helicase [Candidatus Neomarinimicrobiota bacterium]MCF7829349.1 DEAD/DEAH box helicase [Candidatus Neomarinimicrobiota bacterium]MCF7879988.1 DEAD/DEAH box helicase [Candidatus Neomarinimicrobiota bacterium]